MTQFLFQGPSLGEARKDLVREGGTGRIEVATKLWVDASVSETPNHRPSRAQ